MAPSDRGFGSDAASAGPNKREQRLDGIRSHLMTLGTASIEELTALTGVSRMTIHRDLDELEHRGVLHRTRGGASVEKTLLFEASVDYRLSLERRAKQAIAAYAATLVEPGQVLLLDDSTTSHTFLRALPPDLPVTIVSNFLPNLQVAATRANTHVIALGGDYQPSYQAFFGLLTENALATIHADVLVSSASALRGRSLFHQSQLVISTRRAMVESSASRLLLVDSSKISHTALYLYGSVEDYDHLIVDDRTDSETLAMLSELDVEVHVVEIEGSAVTTTSEE
jgi:DeoR/GlpR family transcriptional regulator of sugar metabolism